MNRLGGFVIATTAGVPLGLVAVVVAVGATALVGKVMDLSFIVTNAITMIGLAVGIDYALFIIERHRGERRRGADKFAATKIAGTTAGKADLFSGITVMLALRGMIVPPPRPRPAASAWAPCSSRSPLSARCRRW